MPYVGRDLQRGNYVKLDDISSSFDGSVTTFNLTLGNSAFYPGSPFAILVSLGGIIQEPESAYTINQSQITFAAAPHNVDNCFIIALGLSLGIGVPGHGTVDGDQLAKPLNYNTGDLYLDSTNNRIGVGNTSPQYRLDVTGDANVSGNLSVGGTVTYQDVTSIDSVGIITAQAGIHLGIGATSGKIDVATGISTFTKVGIGTDNPLNLLELYQTHGGQRFNKYGHYIAKNNAASTTNYWTFAPRNSGSLGIGRGVPDAEGTVSTVSDKLTIKSSGDVGIGTNNPNQKLHISATNPIIKFTDIDDDKSALIRGASGNLYLDTNDATRDIIFRSDTSSAAEVARITGDGKVGIGTNNPTALLHLQGTGGNTSGLYFKNGPYDAVRQYFNNGNDNSEFVITYDGTGGAELTLHSTGVLGLNEANGDDVLIGASSVIGNARLTIGKAAAGFTTAIALHNTGGDGSKIISSRSLVLGADYDNDTGDAGSLIAFETNGTEKVRITSGGNVGIGLTNPNADIHISSNNPDICLTDENQAADNKNWSITGGNTQILRIQAQTDSYTGGGNLFELYRVNSQLNEFRGLKSGNTWFVVDNLNKKVGINTTAPESLLSLYSEANGAELLHFDMGDSTTRRGWKFLQHDTGASTDLHLQADAGGKYFAICNSSGTEQFEVYTGDSDSAFVRMIPQVSIGSTIVHSGDSDTSMGFPATNTFAIETNGSERFRIDNAGRLLIGTNNNRTTRLATNTFSPKLQLEDDVEAAFSMTRFINSAGPPRFVLQKARGTGASPVVVADDDDIGQILFSGWDGDTFTNGAEIVAEVDGTPGDDQMPGRLIFKTNTGGTANTERLRITSGGDVGISHQLPSAGLHIKRQGRNFSLKEFYDGYASDSGIGGYAGSIVGSQVGERTHSLILESTTTAAADRGSSIGFRAKSGDTLIDVTYAAIVGAKENGVTNSDPSNTYDDQAKGYLSFYTSNQYAYSPHYGTHNIERLRITSGGNVGIGLTNPAGKLHLSSGTSGDCVMILEADTDNNQENDNAWIEFRQDGGIIESVIGQNPYGLDAENNCLVLANSVSPHNGILFKTGTTAGYTNATERMRITGAGKVGIGTNNPLAPVDIFTTPVEVATLNTTNCLQLGLWVRAKSPSNTTGNIYTGITLGEGRAGLYAYDDGGGAAHGLGFWTGSNSGVAERLRIKSSGGIVVAGNANNVATIQLEDNIIGGLRVTVQDETMSSDISVPRKGCIMAITSFTTYDSYPQPGSTDLVYLDTGPSKNILLMTDLSTILLVTANAAHDPDVADFTDNRNTIQPGSADGTFRIVNRTGGDYTFTCTFL